MNLPDLQEKSVALIVPYFGKFPEHFQLWLESCKNNPQFTWIVFSDDTTNFKYPENVRFHQITLPDLKQKFESLLGFEIALERPYKLCDFRPLYGELFKEYLSEYDFWGYCDIDLIFGKLTKFIKNQDLELYDKISVLGHLSVLKNNAEINTIYKKCDYKSILQDKRSKVFDEVRFNPNINEILQSEGYSIKTVIPYADIDPQHYSFGLYQYFSGVRTTKLKRKPLIFEYSNGSVFGWELVGKTLKKTEYAYVHFQKRKMSINTSQIDRFMIVPNEFCKYQTITESVIKEYSKDSVVYILKKTVNRIKNALSVRYMR